MSNLVGNPVPVFLRHGSNNFYNKIHHCCIIGKLIFHDFQSGWIETEDKRHNLGLRNGLYYPG